MSRGNEFNADAKWAEQAARPVTIGGIVYRPRKKTGAVVKQIIEIAPIEEPDENDREAQLEGIDNLYRQCAVLLIDEEGNTPDPVKLSEEVDLEIARDMIAFLMPQGKDDDEDTGKGKVVALRS